MTSSKLLTPTDQDEEHVRKVLRFPRHAVDIKDQPREQVKPESKVEPEQPEKTAIMDDDAEPKKLEASAVLAHARDVKQFLTENLYGTTGYE